MFSQNINFKNFPVTKKSKVKKFFLELKKEYLNGKNLLLSSLSQKYKYSFSQKIFKTFKKYKTIRIIGMGGSILGSQAINSFLKSKIKKKFIFLNNLELKEKKIGLNKTLNIVISKSGNTLETLVNLSHLKINKNTIFITEKKNSYLRQIAENLKCEIIEHKNYIGGRYSVLSEVGMLPAQLMSLNEKKFKQLNNLIKNESFIKALINNVESTLLYIKKGQSNSIILNYDEDSQDLFYWYQQLISESLGKKSKGILPIISSMPKDNHSLLQLYLDGPKDKFFTFFSVKDKKSIKLNNKLVIDYQYYLKNKSIGQVIESQKKATQNVFFQKKIPFRNIEVKNRNEESIGELFCFFMLETILLGRALGVNPFDQPSVELVKTQTKKYLVNSKK